MSKLTVTRDPLESLVLEEEESGARVVIAPARGGMVTRFSVGEVPVLFLDEATLRDPAQSVRGGIPILFPISGKLPQGRYAARGQTFEMKQHGFARNLPWQLLEQSTDNGVRVTLGLEANEVTRVQYPFEFALRFTYRLQQGTLTLEQRFENRGDVPMPIQPGLHPYFFVPDATKARARVETDATRAHDNTTGKEVVLSGPIAFAGRELDLHLLDHGPRETVLHRADLPSIHITFGADQHVLVLWTLPGKDFLCVEPWSEKFGAFAEGRAPLLRPGEAAVTTLSLALVR
jgi:galactose mutarotase-like enzyme